MRGLRRRRSTRGGLAGMALGVDELGEEDDAQLFEGVDPEVGAGQAAPGELAGGVDHVGRGGVEGDREAEAEADAGERGLAEHGNCPMAARSRLPGRWLQVMYSTVLRPRTRTPSSSPLPSIMSAKRR